MSALDFAARAKALEARLIAESVSGTAEAARTAATQAEGKADGAKAAADLVGATLEASRKDIEAATAAAKTAGDTAEAASKAAQIAEQLAREATAAAPRLFASLAVAGLPASVSKIDSTGYDADGRGGASYISDELATAALAKAHPLACFAGEGNRFFRLIPDVQGFITAEQMGCPPYKPGLNVQPYIQAAIDYAHAMKPHGIRGVAFGQEKYELWTPRRKEGVNNPPGGPGDYSGFPILIRRKIALKAAPGGTQLIRKKWNGRDPAEWNTGAEGETAQPIDFVHAKTEVAQGGWFWRGGMFCLVHTTRQGPNDPRSYGIDYTDLAGIAFEGRWRLEGGIPRSTFLGQYYHQGDPYSVGKLEPATGFGWDWSDKPLWFSNLGWTGDVTFDHLEISGFRGEMVYQGGELHGSIRGRRLLLENSDGNGLNPGPVYCKDGKAGRLEIEHLTIRNCFQAFEGGSGRGVAHMGLIELSDCNKGGILHPGDYNQDPMTMAVKPILTIDRVVTSCTGLVEQGRSPGGYEVAFFTHIGEIVATDCVVSIGSAQGNCFDSTVGRITMIAHKAGYTVDFKSMDLGNNYGLHKSQDCLVGEIIHQRTPYARANSIRAVSGFTWTKAEYGPNIRVGKLLGDFAASSQSSVGNTVLDRYAPIVEDLSGIPGAGGTPWNAEATPVIGQITAHFMRLYTSTSVAGTVFPITLPAPTGKYDRGFRFKMAHYVSNCIVSVATTNTRMAKRLIMLRSQEYEFVSTGSEWVQVTPGSVLSAASVATVLAAGADSAPITVYGARIGMEVRVVPQGDTGGAQVIGRVTADNIVTIRNTSAVAAPSIAYRVIVDWAN